MAEGAGALAAAHIVKAPDTKMPKTTHAVSEDVLVEAVGDALVGCVIHQLKHHSKRKRKILSALEAQPKIVLKAIRASVAEVDQEQVFTSIPPISTRTVRVKFKKKDPSV